MNRYDLMDALNQVDEAQLEAAERFFESGKEPNMKRNTIRTVRIVLIAAAVMVMLGATAYAAGLFGLKGREVAPEETFPVHFGTPEDPIDGGWTGTYALEFESPETCQPVRYRFGWLPEGVKIDKNSLDEDGWIRRYDWEAGTASIPWVAHTETHKEGTELYFTSDMYYAPQFVNGGALILLNTVPDGVEEETWGELSVLRFTAENWWSSVRGETTAFDIPRSFVVIFHPEQGWIFTIRGPFPLEELVKIVENLEVEQTEGLVEQSQFKNPYDFFDAAVG